MSAIVTKGMIFEDSGTTLLARILGNAGTPITQASLSSISYAVFDLQGADPATAVQTGTLTISAVVFDALQTSDPRWTVDDEGFNFAHAAPASWFNESTHTYRIEYKFTPASGEVFWAVFTLTTIGIMTS